MRKTLKKNQSKKKSIKKKINQKKNKSKKNGGANDEGKKELIIKNTTQEIIKKLDTPIEYVEEYSDENNIPRQKVPFGLYGIATCLGILVKIDEYYYASHLIPAVFNNKNDLLYINWINLLKNNKDKNLKVYIFRFGVNTDVITPDTYNIFCDIINLGINVIICYIKSPIIGDEYVYGINESGTWSYNFTNSKNQQKYYRITKQMIDFILTHKN